MLIMAVASCDGALLEDYCSQSSQNESDSDSDGDSEEEAQVHARGEFFGCYLLVSQSPEPKYYGKTYIGFTVDPNRRLNQHNGGHHKGGARKTSGRGPWAMVLIVHGFPSHIAALRFEWAWQNPGRSRRLSKELAKKKRKESHMEHKFRVLTEMLSVGPWNGLPLTIRWLRPEFQLSFPANKRPPPHMPLAFGLVDLSKPHPPQRHQQLTQASAGSGDVADRDCRICHTKAAGKVLVQCYHKSCGLIAHLTCLAAKMTSRQPQGIRRSCQLIPVCRACPDCGQDLLWGELVRRFKGNHQPNM